MGWKVSAVIINKAGRIADKQLIEELGFVGLAKINDEMFQAAMYPRGNKVFIGVYKDNIIVCNCDLAMQFFEGHENYIERKLSRSFPGSEICSIILQSTVDLWGYFIISKDQKLRARAGSSDDGTFMDIGDPVDEEIDLLNKATIDGSGNRTYTFDDLPDDIFEESQVGENFVFAICKRYFGSALDENDELLDTYLAGYTYRSFTSERPSKPWWKFW